MVHVCPVELTWCRHTGQGDWLLKWQDQDTELMPQCQLETYLYQKQNNFCIELFVEVAGVLADVDGKDSTMICQEVRSRSQINKSDTTVFDTILSADCVMIKSSMCPAIE